jgi:hypothetical protein
VTVAGQDGERLVTEAMVERARKAYGGDGIGGSHGGAWPFAMRAALAAVAPDIAAAERERVRRECAEDATRLANVIDAGNIYDDPKLLNITARLRNLAAEWSSSGRAPADGERLDLPNDLDKLLGDDERAAQQEDLRRMATERRLAPRPDDPLSEQR